MKTEERQCQNCKAEFEIVQEDFSFYEKIDVPAPTFCPDCRKIRRFSFRNERALYGANCGLCEKHILSIYAPDSGYIVYCKECFFSDKWDSFDYGQDYDFSRSFFEQFQEFEKKVPRLARMAMRTNVNSDYSNYIGDAKNAYLGFSIVNSENISYSRCVDDSLDCMDCSNLVRGELCYEIVQSLNISRSKYLYMCDNCIECYFVFDSEDCQDCFMSSSMRHKRYIFRNEQLTKEEYEKAMEEIDLGDFNTVEKLRGEYAGLLQGSLHKYSDVYKSVDCTGDNISTSKNVIRSFDIQNGEDLRFCDRILGLKGSYDVTGAANGENLYDCIATTYDSNSIAFAYIVDASTNSYYFSYCWDVDHVFACVALRKKKYCIFNKQYDEKEYKELLEKIKKQMREMPYKGENGRTYGFGEFFPVEISPFAYNETIAQEFFPITQERALEMGYKWKDAKEKNYEVTIPSDEIPLKISEVEDGILKEVLGCAHHGDCNEVCTKAFKITPDELTFYRRMGIPLPRFCSNCRHYARLKIRNPLKLWSRKCMCLSSGALMHGDDRKFRQNVADHAHHGSDPCEIAFESPYEPSRPELIYCEQCYQQEVV